MNWGDELCGIEVTPEAWVGGIFEHECEWLVCTDIQPFNHSSTITFGKGKFKQTISKYYYKGDLRGRDGKDRAVCARPAKSPPIFPPRGWAGRDEWELWHEIFGQGQQRIAHGYSWELAYDWHDKTHPLRLLCGTIERGQEYHDCAVDYEDLRDPAALILALQNAQVLAKRLQEGA